MTEPTTAIKETLNQTLTGYRRAAALLRESFEDLDSKPATKFILTWMAELTAYHREFGNIFGRVKRPPIADDFTAAVAIALNEFLSFHGFTDSVRSEQTTHRHRNATRPDVSVWSGDKLIATIECKTNFGWNRHGWQNAHEARSDSLRELFPDCTSYLCVLTQKNWDSSNLENSDKFGKEWFCLCNETPGKVSLPISDDAILKPIEPMMIDLLNKLQESVVSTGLE